MVESLKCDTEPKDVHTKQANQTKNQSVSKGQLNSEWIYEVIVSPKMQIKNYKTNKQGS